MYIVGVDFDNTLISYDDIVHRTAVQRGLLAPNVPKNKKIIRDRIYALPHGELQWQRLQAFLYGEGIKQAKVMDGVDAFFQLCHQADIPIYIVSHKGDFAVEDKKGINLRKAALEWMRENKFFVKEGLGLSKQNVFFEFTRREKIDRIQKLHCTHFIDDLEEIFWEASFPAGVEKMLLAPLGSHACSDVTVFRSWQEIQKKFMDKKSLIKY